MRNQDSIHLYVSKKRKHLDPIVTNTKFSSCIYMTICIWSGQTACMHMPSMIPDDTPSRQIDMYLPIHVRSGIGMVICNVDIARSIDKVGQS